MNETEKILKNLEDIVISEGVLTRQFVTNLEDATIQLIRKMKNG